MTPEEKRKKELAILKASNELLQQSIDKTISKGNEEEANLIKEAKEENNMLLKKMGYTEDDLKNVEYSKVEKKYVDSYNKKYNNKKSENIKNDENIESFNVDLYDYNENTEQNYNNIQIEQTYDDTSADNIDDDVQYDILPLPSKGEPYHNKKSRIPVSFLTASDENIITSPNLYRDGKVVDILLKRKILDKSINPDLLCKGDRDAILIWLRATGYGPEFPIKIHDDETNTDFETTIDLGKIKYKEFKLKSDEDGNFDYKTNNGDSIKFKFLNRLDEIELDKMIKEDNLNAKRFRLIRSLSEIKIELTNDNELSKDEKNKVVSAVNSIQKWINEIKTSDNVVYEKSITNMMCLSIVSINGLSDKSYIKKYVNSMPAIEAFKFRKYIIDNEPGPDLNIEVNRPENLGGGSIKTFLVIDPSIFINIA